MVFERSDKDMFYKIDKNKIDPKDTEEIVDIVADYLSKTYGPISSFSFEIVGEFQTSSYEYRGKDVKQKRKE
jgi:hypothetical protein